MLFEEDRKIALPPLNTTHLVALAWLQARRRAACPCLCWMKAHCCLPNSLRQTVTLRTKLRALNSFTHGPRSFLTLGGGGGWERKKRDIPQVTVLCIIQPEPNKGLLLSHSIANTVTLTAVYYKLIHSCRPCCSVTGCHSNLPRS